MSAAAQRARRRFFDAVDVAAERRALIARADVTGEYVYLTDEELVGWRWSHGYISGAGATGEGMGDS